MAAEQRSVSTTTGKKVRATPEFESPPVVETVLGVQFDPLEGFRDAHAGTFLCRHLKDNWKLFQTVAPIATRLEEFGPDHLAAAIPTISIAPGHEPGRTQFVSNDENRMIQIQKSRFHYNWRKGDGEYPRFSNILPGFERYYEEFRAFAEREGFGEVGVNQWEITYVNHIPLAEWATWDEVFPWFAVPTTLEEDWPPDFVSSHRFDTFRGSWSMIIGDQAGRLHVTLGGGKHKETSQALLVLDLTARGEASSDSLLDGLRLGHDSIVCCFAAMTSPKAHEMWGRIR